MARNNLEIVAVVSPRSVGPTSLFEAAAPITEKNVKEFHSEEQDLVAASDGLKKLGFAILQVGPVTISIGGQRKLFDDVFGVKLQKKKTEVMEGIEADFYSAPGEPAEQLLQAPGELSDLIEGVALAEPPIYYQSPSPLPPLAPPDPAAYRYLFVPDEVGLILNANRVHRGCATGKGILVAMPDTGMYPHPFYIWHGYRVKSTVLGPGAADPTKDDAGHGTAYAANIFATAPDAELVPVKMANDTVGAFNAAVAQNPQVITCSWGYNVDRPGASLSPYLKTLEAAVANAVSSGIVVCFAAGGGHYSFPGSHPDVISVGGVHVNYPFRTYDDVEASNYASSFDSSLYPGRHVPDVCGLVGKRTPVAAPLYMLPVQPGSVLDLPNTGSTDDGWSIISVISAVAQQVGGIVALMLEKDPSLTPADAKKKLKDTATDVKIGTSAMGDTAGPGHDAATGAGLVNAKWAWLVTMGDVAATFFEASAEDQAAMLAAGQMPKVPRRFIADLMDTLRSR